MAEIRRYGRIVFWNSQKAIQHGLSNDLPSKIGKRHPLLAPAQA
jgi:hypothetical protein